MNVPIGIATALVGTPAARRADAGVGLRAGADLPGAALVTGALMLGVYTIVGPAATDGWGAATTLALRRRSRSHCWLRSSRARRRRARR